jgi:hypothetical protein
MQYYTVHFSDGTPLFVVYVDAPQRAPNFVASQATVGLIPLAILRRGELFDFDNYTATPAERLASPHSHAFFERTFQQLRDYVPPHAPHRAGEIGIEHELLQHAMLLVSGARSDLLNVPLQREYVRAFDQLAVYLQRIVAYHSFDSAAPPQRAPFSFTITPT